MKDILRILDRGYTMIWREDRLEDALRGLEDDFEWLTPDMPDGAVRHGAEEVLEFFRAWLEPWEDLAVEWTLHPAGPDTVLAIIDMHGRGRSSGVPTAMQFGQLWTFRDGRAIRMVIYNDVDEARRAAGLG